MEERKNIRVAIVEDTEDILTSLKTLINSDSGFECIASCSSGAEAILLLPDLIPDVVLMDIHMPGMTGIECVSALKPMLPKTHFVMFTVYQDDDSIYEALRAGAVGYLLKKSTPAKIMESIRDVYEGGSPMSGEIARRIINGVSGRVQHASALTDLLTERENEILGLLSKGLLYKEIADHLSVSKETIKKHIQNIYKKLHVQNRTEAINKAFLK